MAYYFRNFTGADVGVLPWGIIALNIWLAVFLAVCMYTDATKEKIYNKVTFPTMLAGLLLNLVAGGLQGLAWSAVGLAVGMAIQWIPFALHLAKAGDVKLLMAVGALKGWAFCVFGFVYGAAAFIFIIIPILWRKRELGEVGGTVKSYVSVAVTTQQAPSAPAPKTEKKYVPWGIALGVGFYLALIMEVFMGRPFWFDPFWTIPG